MKRGVYLLPNGLTLCGMFFGFFSVLSSVKGEFETAAWTIVIAGVFDGLDGWVARLTNTTSKFGVELDSLSDLVAFGVAPGVLLYSWSLTDFGRIGIAAAFLFTVCGALRLARFNVQMATTESKAFTGMPIPAAAGIAATTVLFHARVWGGRPERSYTVLLLTLVLAIIMVSTLTFHGTKDIDFRRRKPFWVLVAFCLVVALITIHPPTVLFLFGMGYLTWGIIENTLLYIRRSRKTMDIVKEATK